jgi:predicted  nucleic acid-binding Zn-ribbon protein
LLQLQEADIAILRVKKRLDSLPIKAALIKERAKRGEIEMKASQIEALRAQGEEQAEKFQNEDAELAAKIAHCQKTIDETKDYRVITSVTRDMEGHIKRREKIEFDMGILADRLAKIEDLARQAAHKTKQCNDRDAELIAEYRKAGVVGQAEIDAALNRREEAAANISKEHLDVYEKIRKVKGGIGATKLEGNCCSVCRIEYHDSQLSHLQSGPDVSTCPICHRLIVVRGA